jgi:SAM-dependent methyltransferase
MVNQAAMASEMRVLFFMSGLTAQNHRMSGQQGQPQARGPRWYRGPVKDRDRATAERVRARLERGARDALAFRASLEAVPPLDRDAWLDVALGLGPPPADGPELPPGGVPYLPCAVDSLLRFVDAAGVAPTDVVVDVGSGAGRAAVALHLLAGAAVVGVEVQPALVAGARALAARLDLARVTFVEGDGAAPPAPVGAGTVFFLYCPFGGERLARFLAWLEPIARARAARLACVDLPLPPVTWLEPVAPPDRDLAVFRARPVSEDDRTLSREAR